MTTPILVEGPIIVPDYYVKVSPRKEKVERSLKSILPKWKDRVLARLLLMTLSDGIIKPILDAKVEELESEFEESIDRFGEISGQLENLVQSQVNLNIDALAVLDKQFYNTGMYVVDSNDWIPDELSQRLSHIVNAYKDYLDTMRGIYAEKRNISSYGDIVIDAREYFLAVYGTQLSIWCILRLINNTKKVKNIREKLAILAKQGSKYAEKLEELTDTFDILSNPDEREMMKRAEEWEKRQLQNS